MKEIQHLNERVGERRNYRTSERFSDSNQAVSQTENKNTATKSEKKQASPVAP